MYMNAYTLPYNINKSLTSKYWKTEYIDKYNFCNDNIKKNKYYLKSKQQIRTPFTYNNK